MRRFTLLASAAMLFGAFCGQPSVGQDAFEPLSEEKPREWTVTTPKGTQKLDARLVGLKRGVAQFQQPDGKAISVPLDQLSQEDRRAALIERVGSGVVMIATKDLFGDEAGFGSGFVMHNSGLILTNYHVIAGAGEVEISFRDHEDPFVADVLSVDRNHDVAFLRIKDMPADVHVLELQSAQLPVSGSSVWSLGHPSGLKNTVGWGDINAVRKTSDMPEQIREALKTPDNSRWLQTNAVLARGSSGGPLLNELGQAVGINTLLMGPQIGFAIHVSHAQPAYLEAKKGAALTLPLAPGEHQDAMAWPSREVGPVLKEYLKEYEALEKAANGLPQQETQNRLTALQTKYRQQFMELAQKTPGEWPSLQSLAYAAEFCSDEKAEPALKEICDLAIKHNGESIHLGSIVKAVAKQPTDAAREFCRKVKEISPHALVRTGADYHLAANLLRWLQAPDSIELAKLTQPREEIERLMKELEADFKQKDSPISGEDGKAILGAFREGIDGLVIGAKAKEIKGVDIHGKEFTLGEYEGKAVLLDFFADWCPHCRRMYPAERDMVVKYKDRSFALLGVHCESQDVLNKLDQNKSVTWRCWADGSPGPIAANWQVDSFPTLYLLDHQGIVRWQSNGVPDEAELAKMIEQLVAEADAAAKAK